MPIVYKKSAPARVPVVYRQPKKKVGESPAKGCSNNDYIIATGMYHNRSGETIYTYKIKQYCLEPKSFKKVENASLAPPCDSYYGNTFGTVYVPSGMTDGGPIGTHC